MMIEMVFKTLVQYGHRTQLIAREYYVKVPLTHWTGGWVGPRAFLDAVVKRKISSPRRKSNPRSNLIRF
jgi:hypothetical protein